MRLILAVTCLTVLVVALLACFGVQRRRVRRAWGVLLVLVSVAWLPLNNRAIEGPVLYTVTHEHGLTTADLVGLFGVLVGAITVWPPSRWRSVPWVLARVGVVVVLVAIGFTLAVVVTDDATPGSTEVRAQHPAHHVPGMQASTYPVLTKDAPTARTEPTQFSWTL